jgi:subtilisin family serine protease
LRVSIGLRKTFAGCASGVVLIAAFATGPAPAATRGRSHFRPTPAGEAPAGRYFVTIEGGTVAGSTDLTTVRSTQLSALDAARTSGGEIVFRYGRLVNGFSVELPAGVADRLAARGDVVSVTPVGVISPAIDSSVPFIGARRAWNRLDLNGKGVRIAVVDSGVDYTHAAFGGAGTRDEYDANDPTIVEQGSFPTKRVVDGHDFVGENYDVDDGSSANDTPDPDPDPLDSMGHGSHVAGICCSGGVPERLGKGVAFRSKILAYKVWSDDTSTADVLVAAFERAVDPNGDGDLDDRADIISFSGSVTYGSPASVESQAAQAAVEAGTVVVAAAGNAGGQFSYGGAYRAGGPSTAPGVISVAASRDPSDQIALFSSEGPARVSNALKPDISAPGEAIRSVSVGSGKGDTLMSGTSMSAPHISGSAALVLQAHPRWSPSKVKAALMNHALPKVKDGKNVVAAGVMGAGRVRVDESAEARSLVVPGSVSFGLRYLEGTEVVRESLTLMNNDSVRHHYVLNGSVLNAGVGEGVATVRVSADGEKWGRKAGLDVRSHSKRTIYLKVSLNGDAISTKRQLDGWYSRQRALDGGLTIHQSENGRDVMRVPWHVVVLAASDVESSAPSFAVKRGSGSVKLDARPSAGTAAADAYLLGGKDGGGDIGVPEADVSHFGVRSYTGRRIGDGPRGLPSETDAHSGATWKQFLTANDELREPIEFLVRTRRSHQTTETLEISVAIDVGADGEFESSVYKADYLAVKLPFRDGTCVYDMSLERPFRTCKQSYLSDYSRYNSNLTGIVVNAKAIGLTNSASRLSYRVVACSDSYSGDVALPVCDTAGGMKEGTYKAKVDVTDPSLDLNRWFCGGFWSNTGCSSGFKVEPGAQFGPSKLLLIFPNNDFARNVATATSR